VIVLVLDQDTVEVEQDGARGVLLSARFLFCFKKRGRSMNDPSAVGVHTALRRRDRL